jgi:hypothetical protein
MSYRLSIAERIALTSGFRTSSDSRVLIALASFAHYDLGTNARPSVEKLQARVPDLSLRTIARCLQRLEEDGWIEGVRHHRRPTTYRICIERLATSPTMAKVVVSHDRVDCQSGSQDANSLTATLAPLTATLSGLTAKVAVHPVLDPDLDPSAPALIAPGRTDGGTADAERGESLEVPDATAPLRTGVPHVRANGGDHPDVTVQCAERCGGDHRPAPGVGLHLQQVPDLPGDGRADGSCAPMGPSQPTLGPMDVTPPDEQHQRFMEELRARVGAPAAATVRRRRFG